MKIIEKYFNSFIPTPSHNTGIIGAFDKVDSFDGLVVLCHLYGLITVEVPHLHCLITRGRKHFRSVLSVDKQLIEGKTDHNISHTSLKARSRTGPEWVCCALG